VSWRSGLAERVGGVELAESSWRSRVGGVELALVAAHRVDGHGAMPLEFANVGWLLSRPSRCGSEWLGTGAGPRLGRTAVDWWFGCPGTCCGEERPADGRDKSHLTFVVPMAAWPCGSGLAERVGGVGLAEWVGGVGWRSGLAEWGRRSRVGVGRGSPRRWARNDAAGVRECRMAFKPSVPLRVRVAWDRCGAEVGANRG